jgi:hypothetical protein
MVSRLGRVWAVALLAALSACAGAAPVTTPGAAPDIHIPPFAKRPYQAFSRDAAVQIAYREWRAFGQKLVTSPTYESPDSRERDEGLWQRVGEYWWLGLDYGSRESAWTGIHDASGAQFPRAEDGSHAWSAAFISYVMRMAGAGRRFPYASSHSDYINAARIEPGVAISAQRLDQYAPVVGDLICAWRGARPLRFEDLPAGHFPGHCDIVVARNAGSLEVIGGNVDNAVSMKRVPVGADGRLVGPTGAVIDPDYPWFVVLRVDYQR